MSGKERMSIETFGSYLLRSRDLDPIYVMLSSAKAQGLLTFEQLHNWSVAYWCCYHAGVASFLADTHRSDVMWEGLQDVAENHSRRWPRGTERRHFRGANAVNLIADLESKYPKPSDLVRYLADGMMPNDAIPTTPFPMSHCKPRTFKVVAERAQQHVGFGPWIAFKIADMLERVMGYTVDFSDCLLGVYRDPVRGAHLACEHWCGDEAKGWNDLGCLNYAVNRLMDTFGDEVATGGCPRFINIQEIETILCKWKSHMNGHYPPGKDTKEIRHALQGWGSLAEQLSTFLPQEVDA